MVTQYFSKIDRLSIEIQQAIDADDLDRVNMLDEQYVEVWDQIVAYEPNDNDEAKTMVLLLLNRLADRMESSREFDEIRRKILGLFGDQQQPTLEPQPKYGT